MDSLAVSCQAVCNKKGPKEQLVAGMKTYVQLCLGISISDQKFNAGIQYFFYLNTRIPVLLPGVGILGTERKDRCFFVVLASFITGSKHHKYHL